MDFLLRHVMHCRLFSQILGIMLLLVVIPEIEASNTRVKQFSLPGHGHIELPVPKGWYSKIQQPPNQLPPTITFSPKDQSFQVLLTPIWSGQNIQLPSKTKLKEMVIGASKKIKEQSIEKKLIIKNLNGKHAKGYYYSATDKEDKPNEYRYITQGMMLTGKLMFTFTILTHDISKKMVTPVLNMLGNARHITDSNTGNGYTRIFVPQLEWQLQYPSAGWELVQKKSRPDQTAFYYHLSHKSKALNFSVYLDKTEKCKTPVACRDMSWSIPNPSYKGAKGVKKTIVNGFGVIQFYIDQPMGHPAIQSNILAHSYRDDYWIDIHLSKISKDSVDYKDMMTFLKEISFQPR